LHGFHLAKRFQAESGKDTDDFCAKLIKQPYKHSASTQFKQETQMKQSTKDNVEGKMHQVKGKAKEIAGKIMDDHELEAEGKMETLGGKAQEKIGQVEKVAGK